jgi:hypothetical protein
MPKTIGSHLKIINEMMFAYYNIVTVPEVQRIPEVA